jgi:hypothetical protein
MNGLAHPTPILARKIKLKNKPPSPSNDHGVNIALGPLLKKLVEF